MKISGFLYGHYDSRGGCTFVERKTKEEADVEYVRAFGVDEWAESPADKVVAEQQIIEEDFLGTATIESGPDIPNGTDIEYRDDSLNLWVRQTNSATGGHHSYELVVNMGSPGEGFEESSLGEDAFGVVVVREGHTTLG